MKVTSERLEDSQVRLHIEVEPERSAKSIDQAYQRLVNRISIPGFRKGKAPRQLVMRMIGQEALVQEGIELLIPQLFREAVAETGVEPIAEPTVDVVQQEPLVVDMTVAVRPTVELGEYRDIRTERDTVTVKDDEVELVLQNLREQQGEWVPVERAVAAGDRVTMDVIGQVRGAPVLYDPSGQPILASESGKTVIDQKDVEYTVEKDSRVPVAGFAEQLIGVQAGDEKSFEISFPADHPDSELASKSVIFHVTLHTVKEQRLPELDDELAKTVGDHDSLDSLRSTVRENLRRRAENEALTRLEERIVKMVADRARIELPAALIDRETDRLVARTERSLLQASINMDDFLRVTKKGRHEFRAQYRADAIANLRRFLVLDAVSKEEHIEISDEDVSAEIERITAALGEEGAKLAATLNEPARREEISEDLRQRKVLARLVDLATGEDEKPAAEADTPSGEASEA